MNVREVFCIDCYEWRKREDLVESQWPSGELYCAECGAVLIRTDDYNPNKERKYTVRLKGIDYRFNWLMYDTQLKIYVLGAFGNRDCQNIFTEKQLSRDGLGHVLYNDAFEVREVEE
ncbi:hypothetical protein KJR36_03625 [Streptococcus infantarius subsp. infantarius]|uniref:hypothetical protein n=1 Tax=Streptococcus infantarius TaxID=102684 RepID=UPI001BDB30A6|nr:hypothetical protein [Streptococcus infantarius]MBT0903779.1 hypothetical protein [Streptococcus infantarius subsp. infantarius]MBT0917692.1 hypothetical protein [Streptococcus infantarius subsp. infantarius]